MGWRILVFYRKIYPKESPFVLKTVETIFIGIFSLKSILTSLVNAGHGCKQTSDLSQFCRILVNSISRYGSG
jgi:hypothetical protein